MQEMQLAAQNARGGDERGTSDLTDIFDTHAHYNSHKFDADREQVLARLGAQGIAGICECATHSGDAPRCVALAEKYPFVYAAVGIHPESLIEEDAATVAVYHGDWRAELADLRPLLAHPKVVAVGEIGLDHHWDIPAQEQYDLFEAQLQLAKELELPVIIHDRQAHAEIYELVKKYRPKGVMHCYSGSAEDAVWLTGQGLYIGFGGALTFRGAKRALQAAVAVPPDKLLLETDCPYMAPEPFRGRRCDSGMLPNVVALLAEIKGISQDRLRSITHENARALFEI